MLTRSQELAKRVVKFAVHKLGGGRSAEQFTGIGDDRLSKYISAGPDSGGTIHHIPLYKFLELSEAADHEPLKFLARQYGFDFVTADERREIQDGLVKLAGRAAQAVGDFVATAADAGSDGICSHNEVAPVDIKKAAAINAVENLAGAVVNLPRIRGAK